MAYDKHIFNKGDKLTAAQLNTMNDEIEKLDEYKAESSDVPSALSQLDDDSTHRLVTDSEKSTWNAKQDAISDIATIRSNATKAGNMEIGGRNYLRNTGDLSKWIHDSSMVPYSNFSGNTATIGYGDSLDWSHAISSYPKTMYSDVKNKIITFSCLLKRNGESDEGNMFLTLQIGSTSNDGNRTRHRDFKVFKIAEVDTEWMRVTYTSDTEVTDDFFTSSDNNKQISSEDIYLTFKISNHSFDTIQIKDIKLEAGNQATDWTPSPEDSDNTCDIVNKIIGDIYTSNSVSASQTVTGWMLIAENGLCQAYSTRQLIKFACTAGNLYKIVGTNLWQFQTDQYVPSSGTSNRIGITHCENGYFIAPTNAKYIICDCSTSSTAACYLMSK